MTTPAVRALTSADARAVWELGNEAFGYGDNPPDPLPDPTALGRLVLGVVDGDRLRAKAAALPHRTWWGGREVPTAGIAGVAVHMEERGAGLLTPLIGGLLDAARDRGDVICLYYPSAQGIYRRFGHETIGAYDQVELATRDLADARVPHGLDVGRATLRRGLPPDADAVQRVYTAWARQHDGPLTRTGPAFPEAAGSLWAEGSRMQTTVAEEGGDITGYAVWHRLDGRDGHGMEVYDLVATTPGAHLALLRGLGSHHTVAPRTRLWTSAPDLVRTFLPTSAWQVVDHRPLMLGVLDVPGAFQARGYPDHLVADLTFRVTGDEPVAGCYRLRVSGGRAECERVEEGRVGAVRTVDPRGLVLSYAGALPSAAQRAAGLLTGPDDDDPLWDCLAGGRQVHLRDYF